MNSWGIWPVVGVLALVVLIALGAMIFRRPKKKEVQTYTKPKKKKKNQYGKKRNGKSH